MTKDELEFLKSDLQRFESMLRESTCSSIVSEMVNYESMPFDNFNKVLILSTKTAESVPFNSYRDSSKVNAMFASVNSDAVFRE